MPELEDAAREAVEREPESWLNSAIGVLVAITATFMALGNIKDGNIVQAMAQAQVKAVDSWSYYQAKSTKQHLAENTLEALTLRLETEPALNAAARMQLESAAERHHAEVQKYDAEKEAIRKEATGYEQEYDRLNTFDDQFDLADACFTLALALYGITVLLKSRWLFGFAATMTSLGAIFAVAAFLGWRVHPDMLTKLLT